MKLRRLRWRGSRRFTSIRNTIIHMRPRSWPIVFGHYAAGAAVVLANTGREDLASAGIRAIFGGILWTVFLNGGTLALNSAYDEDTGDIGYLDNPPPVPEALASTSILLMIIGLFCTMLLPPVFGALYALSMLLSLAYSIPPWRLKAVAGADLLVNMTGYGGLTFAAGAVAALTASSDIRIGVISLLALSFAFLFGAFYPMTQIYQIPEDAARGDLTLAVRLGPRKSLLVSLAAILVFLGFQLLACKIGEKGILSMILIAVAALAWLAFSADWLRRLPTYPAQKGMYRALKIWAVTDVLTVIAFALGR